MQCPNCGSQNPQGSAFCGSCGTNLQPGQAAGAQQPTQPIPPPQPTQQMPAQAPQQPAQQAPYAAAPDYGVQQPQPSGGTNTALIIAILALAGLLLVGGTIGAFFLFTQDDPATDPATQADSGTSGGQTGTSSSSGSAASGQTDVGYATARAAVEAEVPSDWVIDLMVDDGASVEFWVGPANSEYTDGYVVEQMADGSWVVTDVQPITAPDDGGATAVYGQDEAVTTVGTFLDAIMDDRPMDAHALTVEPFSNDPASAQYSDGDFYGYAFDGVDSYEDGTFRVYVIETWAWGDEYFAYYVVPTELGYYISEVEPY